MDLRWNTFEGFVPAMILAAVVCALPVEAAPCEAFRFAPPRIVAPLPGWGTARVIDLNRDGLADVVVLANDRTWVRGALQRPDGTFAGLPQLETKAFGLLVGDFDGDGAQDAVLLLEDGPRQLLLGPTGRIETGPPAVAAGTISDALPLAVADVDGDGRSEILVNAKTDLVALREGADGAFRRSVLAALDLGAGRGLSLVAGDFNGDGHVDVVATAENYPTFTSRGRVLWGDGRGGFVPGAPFGLPTVQSAVVADFNGDGLPDFAWAGFGISPTTFYWTAGLEVWDGADGLKSTFLPILSWPANLLAADLDRDGLSDLVVVGRGATSGRLFRSLGSSFLDRGYVSGFEPTDAADLDGDGAPDLVGTDGTAIRVARNICGTTLPDVTVPVVVSVSGANGVRFETEMTIDDLAWGGPYDLEVRFVPSFGGQPGTAMFRLESGGQLFFPSILDALAEAGVPVSRDGDRGGSLAIRVVGGSAQSVAVATRVVALGAGQGGTGFVERSVGDGATSPAIVGWLREDGRDRSNLDVANLGGEREGNVVVRVTLVSLDPEARSVVLPDVLLAPGAIHQWNRVLAGSGMPGGWARVERVSGNAPFFAWGVVNDEGTGDGSFVAGFEAARVSPRSWVVPAVVESGRYASDLVVTNARNELRALSCRLVSETLTSDDRTARFRLEIPPFGQLFLPALVDELRRRGVAGIPPRGAEVVGAVFVDIEGEAVNGLFLGVRTSAQKPEGRYGVFYEAVPADQPKRASAVVPAVRQDASVRTKVAIVNLEDQPVVLTIWAVDPSASGRAVGGSRTITLGPYRWAQVDSVLEALGTGLTRGRVVVSSTGGAARYLVYGITNEGARPDEGSDDGTYVAGR